METMNPLSTLKMDIEKTVSIISESEWNEVGVNIIEMTVRKGKIILKQSEICREVLRIVDGIAASEHVVDEKSVIVRFFQKGEFCTNVISALTATTGAHSIISLTPLQAVSIPFELFMELYHRPSVIGQYIREKVMQTIFEDATIISAKTICTSETLDQLLRDNYPEIISRVSDRYIAQFIGITPETYSRMQKRRHERS